MANGRRLYETLIRRVQSLRSLVRSSGRGTMTTDDSKAKAAQHNGYLRGLEMGKAVIEDAWERQAYLMERKQREHQIAQNVFSPDIGAAYLRGFTDGLQRYPVEAHLADAEQQAAEEKITEWIETLRPLGEAARADGVETARALIAAAKAHDRFKLHALKSELIKTAEKHRGIQRR